ncbi:MAG: SDR family oxidoreductase [Candidatus Goldiibacteriota bacterium]
MNKKILVTGAGGNTGIELIKKLCQKGLRPAAGTTDTGAAAKKLSDICPGIEMRQVIFDGRPRNITFNGIDRIFLIRPPQISNVKKYMFPFIDAALKSGIRQIVFLSLQGAQNNPITPHRKIELYMIRKNAPYTFLRPSFFMQNLSTTHRDEIKYNNEIFIPAGNGRTSFIDVKDIAETAAKILTENSHIHKAYELTGRDSITYHEAARILSKYLGRTVTYSGPGLLKFIFRKIRRGYSIPFTLVMSALYTLCRLGKAGKKTNTFKNLTGRDPGSFENFVIRNLDVWEPRKIK